MGHFLGNLARTAGTVLALTAAGEALANNTAGEIFGERQLAIDLDARCGLFTEAQHTALEAARLQARGVLLRDGVSATALADYAREIAAQADGIDCNLPEVADLQARVAGAFAAWQTMRDMEFPGQDFGWSATRSFIAGQTGWALLQDTGTIRVGISRRDAQRRFTILLPDASNAASAVLVLRDMDRAPQLYDPTVGGIFPAPEGAEWADWTPPDFARSMIWAAGRGSAETVAGLSADGSGLVFHFSERAADALAARDPREAARIELIDRNGRVIAGYYFEIGDFAAARAFIRAGDPVAPRS